MVKIAIAGAGEVGREILDALIATQKHEIIILTRSEGQGQPGCTRCMVHYDDKDGIAVALKANKIHTVLSFIQLLYSIDPGKAASENLIDGVKAQKNLINACVRAGVKRFAPSEWASRGSVKPLWAGKDKIREYLEKLNENGKVLEYCLFQPGLFLNYLATPHKTCEHVTPLNTFIDLQNRRAIVVAGTDPVMTLTTVQDLAAVIVRAVDFEGEWPAIGGIRGNSLCVSQIITIAERVRGGPFRCASVTQAELMSGKWNPPWMLEAKHHAVSEAEAEAALKSVLLMQLNSSVEGAWDVSDEWNRMFPDFEFQGIEKFLGEVWEGKP